jgi:DNA processing protein
MMESLLRLANLQLAPRTAVDILEYFKAEDAIFSASHDELLNVTGITDRQAARILDPTYVPTSKQIRFIEENEIHLLSWCSEDYPAMLRNIPDPPPVLFVRGRMDEKDRFSIGIVGSRQATPYGRSVTARFARELARAGLTIVSGGAIGIDAAAHAETLKAGGRTLIIHGCGLDIPYPRENLPIFDRTVSTDRGALITEFPPGATPEPWRFPMRNRIISALSLGIVVIEAGEKSGALLTATCAGEQGKEVMAIPGNIDRPASRGTNALIQDGAALVQDPKDVMRVLGLLMLEQPSESSRSDAASGKDLPESQRRLLSLLSLTPKHIDALAAEAKMSADEAGTLMTLLEMEGLAHRLPGSSYIRVL